ncbi:12020_t:CDS:1, partial [Dentiscutata heterogama]
TPNQSQIGGFAVTTHASPTVNPNSSSTTNQSQFGGFGGLAATTHASQMVNNLNSSSTPNQSQFGGFSGFATHTQPHIFNLSSNTSIQPQFNFQQSNVAQQAFTSDSIDIPKQQNDPTIPTLETLYNFLRFQSFDGKFLPSDDFYSYFKKDEVENNDLKEYGIRNGIDETIWTTSVAVGYLEIIMSSKFGEESDLCKEKAERWLEKMSGNEKMKVLEVAREWVREWVKK